jgi:hypothetical protein|tara:strand:+ start:412 stop:969 length:558 start_codon:yes stop_codon:yes gene_type:complete
VTNTATDTPEASKALTGDPSGGTDEQMAEDVDSEMAALEVDDQETDEIKHLFRYIRLRSRYKEELKRVEAQTDKMIMELVRRIGYLDHANEIVARETVSNMLKGRKQRSVKTPFGNAGFRKTQDLLVVSDENLVKVAVENGQLPEECVKTETKIDKSGLNTHMQNTGEIPMGCSIRAGTDRFYVK